MLGRNQWLSAAAALVALAVTCKSAEAQPRPFKITGGGIGPIGLPLPGQDPRPHWAVGNATYLGKYYGEGAVQTDANNLVFHEDGSITGEFGSAVPFVFGAANGDLLACHYGRVDVASGKASGPGTFTLALVSGPGGPGSVYVAAWIAEFVPVVEECTGRFAGISGSWTMYAYSLPFVLGSTDPIAYTWEGDGYLSFASPKGEN